MGIRIDSGVGTLPSSWPPPDKYRLESKLVEAKPKHVRQHCSPLLPVAKKPASVGACFFRLTYQMPTPDLSHPQQASEASERAELSERAAGRACEGQRSLWIPSPTARKPRAEGSSR